MQRALFLLVSPSFPRDVIRCDTRVSAGVEHLGGEQDDAVVRGRGHEPQEEHGQRQTGAKALAL